MRSIKNFSLNNAFFAECLRGFNLIHPNDCIVERCDSILDCVSINSDASDKIILTRPFDIGLDKMLQIRERSIDINGKPLYQLDDKVTYNYICNGVYGEAYSSMLSMIDKGAFNVGIATDDELLYSLVKDFYMKFYKELIADDIPIAQIDCCQNNTHAYLLSYRKGR